MGVCSTLIVMMGLGLYSFVHAQTHGMAIHEPHMSAAYGHLEQAKSELERAAAGKGGHRERAMQLIDQAMQQIQEGERYAQEHQGRR
jgi:hypothetical protein